ncbi:MAG: HAD hydrolase family protein [Gammaproteobacteria bacterium]|nr:HAD hydrolase family protein [Gammaproteobacteria bacterium]
MTSFEVTALVRAKLEATRALVLDVDGVMTTGVITMDDHGNELKTFHVHDGYGIYALMQRGIRVAIISGRRSAAVERRARELNITDVYQGLKDKSIALAEFASLHGLNYLEIAHIGDDIPDLVLFEHVGLAVAVANAVPRLKECADLILTRSGGDGAIREFSDLLLSVQRA